MGKGPVAVLAVLLALPLAGCLAQHARVVPDSGGVSCGEPALATWHEPGLFEALVRDGHARPVERPGLPLDAPDLRARWGRAALGEVYVQHEAHARQLRLEPREEGVHVSFTYDARLAPAARAADLHRLLAPLSDATAAEHAAWLAALPVTGRGSMPPVPFETVGGTFPRALDGTRLWAGLSAAPPWRAFERDGAGAATYVWARPDGEQVFVTVQAPHVELRVPFHGGVARLGVGSDDRAALFAPAATLRDVPAEARDGTMRALALQSFAHAGLAEPSLAAWRVPEDAFGCMA